MSGTGAPVPIAVPPWDTACFPAVPRASLQPRSGGAQGVNPLAEVHSSIVVSARRSAGAALPRGVPMVPNRPWPLD